MYTSVFFLIIILVAYILILYSGRPSFFSCGILLFKEKLNYS